jgi:hypothetical protein
VPTAKSGIAAKRGSSSSAIASISSQLSKGSIVGGFGFGFLTYRAGFSSIQRQRVACSSTCRSARKTP